MGQAVDKIVSAVDRLYALTDSTFNAVPRSGTYNATTGVTVFAPVIPAGPGTRAIKALEVRDNEALTESLEQGLTLDLVATELAEIKALLATMDAEEDLTEIIARLGAILALL